MNSINKLLKQTIAQSLRLGINTVESKIINIRRQTSASEENILWGKQNKPYN
jgi:hypothetical protein